MAILFTISFVSHKFYEYMPITDGNSSSVLALLNSATHTNRILQNLIGVVEPRYLVPNGKHVSGMFLMDLLRALSGSPLADPKNDPLDSSKPTPETSTIVAPAVTAVEGSQSKGVATGDNNVVPNVNIDAQSKTEGSSVSQSETPPPADDGVDDQD